MMTKTMKTLTNEAITTINIDKIDRTDQYAIIELIDRLVAGNINYQRLTELAIDEIIDRLIIMEEEKEEEVIDHFAVRNMIHNAIAMLIRCGITRGQRKDESALTELIVDLKNNTTTFCGMTNSMMDTISERLLITY